MRVRYGPVSLPKGLLPGRYRELAEGEVNTLLAAAGMAKIETMPQADSNPTSKAAPRRSAAPRKAFSPRRRFTAKRS
jgi:hypothetical protein